MGPGNMGLTIFQFLINQRLKHNVVAIPSVNTETQVSALKRCHPLLHAPRSQPQALDYLSLNLQRQENNIRLSQDLLKHCVRSTLLSQGLRHMLKHCVRSALLSQHLRHMLKHCVRSVLLSQGLRHMLNTFCMMICHHLNHVCKADYQK
jgi:hypothetical protein